MSRVVKQLDNWSCAACVAAMITGETLKDVVEFIGHDGSAIHEDSEHPDKRICFSKYEIDSYLLSRGYSFSPEIEIYDQKQIGSKKVSCDIDTSVRMYLVVTSDALVGCTHAVYWDGKNVCEPNPSVREHRPMNEYEISHILLIWEYDKDDVNAFKKYHTEIKAAS